MTVPLASAGSPPLAVTARPADASVRQTPPDRADPCTVVILGAAGDLTKRKLLPALYQLAREDLLAGDFRVLGVSRETIGLDGFRSLMRGAVEQSDEIPGEIDESVWDALVNKLHYVAGAVRSPAT